MAPDSGPAQTSSSPDLTPAWLRAFSVHVFTACGAGCALLALLAAAGRDWTTMFLWLGVALLIDGIDGTFARMWKVSERAPRWSGDVLDFVVDFTTYVFVPAFALATSGLLPSQLASPLALGIVVSAAIYFADREMKTKDNCFRGFPALWNGVAFHLFLLAPPPWVSAAAVVALIVLTFAPLKFVHPIRVARFRALTLTVLIVWSALAVYALTCGMNAGLFAAWLCTACAIYLLTIGLIPTRS
jgi:phosphatidylcholine synthase